MPPGLAISRSEWKDTPQNVRAVMWELYEKVYVAEHADDDDDDEHATLIVIGPNRPCEEDVLPDALDTNSVLHDRYHVLGILNASETGAVYLARDLHFANVNRNVAVKELFHSATSLKEREVNLRNFERETDILASLNHPAIPQIHDYFCVGDRTYLIMQYVDGRDLERIIAKADDFLRAGVVLNWAIELCDALHYLHTHKPDPIIFRNLKPSSVMIGQNLHVRLVSFGLAKNFTAGERGTKIGVEGYAPPEQRRGETVPRSDIYALGATLHHALTRHDPRLEAPHSFAARSIRSINPNVPPAFEALIMRALSKKVKDRPTALEMKAELEVLRDG